MDSSEGGLRCRVGRHVARLIHGNVRSPEGYLLTSTNYFDYEAEWKLGLGYLGLLGAPVFLLGLLLTEMFYHDIGYHIGNRHVLGPWSEMPLGLKLIMTSALAGFAIALWSAFRTFAIWAVAGSREDLETWSAGPGPTDAAAPAEPSFSAAPAKAEPGFRLAEPARLDGGPPSQSMPTEAANAYRYAAYPFWFWLAVVEWAAFAVILAEIGYFIAFVKSGGTLPSWPFWIVLPVGFVCGGRSRRQAAGPAPVLRLIGDQLASSNCWNCGQSIFDPTPATGYAPEPANTYLLPQRFCANCEADLAQQSSKPA